MWKSRRRALFADPNVQSMLVTRIVLHWFSFFGVVFVLSVSLEFLLGGPTQSLSSAARNMMGQSRFLLLILAAMIPAFVYDTIRVSNRFAGPMVRLRRAVRELANGESVSPLVFRKGDVWSDLADDFNRLCERIEVAERHAESSKACCATGGEAIPSVAGHTMEEAC